MIHTATAPTKAPATIQPVVTSVPRKQTTAREMIPTQTRHAATRRINAFGGWKDEINNN